MKNVNNFQIAKAQLANFSQVLLTKVLLIKNRIMVYLELYRAYGPAVDVP